MKLVFLFLLCSASPIKTESNSELEFSASQNLIPAVNHPNFATKRTMSFSNKGFNETSRYRHGNRKELWREILTNPRSSSYASPWDVLAFQHRGERFQQRGNISNDDTGKDQYWIYRNSKFLQKRDLTSRGLFRSSTSTKNKMASVSSRQESHQTIHWDNRNLSRLSQPNHVNTMKFQEFSKTVLKMDVADLSKIYEILTTFLRMNLYLSGCHVVLVTQNSSSPLYSSLIRSYFKWEMPLTIVDLETVNEDKERLLQEFWGQPTVSCRGLVIDIVTAFTSAILEFLETCKLWRWPETKVTFLGSRKNASHVLAESALRNTIQPLYIAFPEEASSNFRQFQNDSGKLTNVYTRCLYCNYGLPQVKLMHQIPLESMTDAKLNIPSEKMLTFHGQVIRVTSLNYYPYVEYKLDTDEPGTTVTLLDSMDKRMFDSIAAHANITFVVRIPVDGQAGYLMENGTWTGRIRDLIEEVADICTTAVLNPERAKVIDQVMTCDTDRLVIVSLMPQVLPEYLVIIKPFTGEVWLFVLLSIIFWGINLWVVLKSYSLIIKKKTMSFSQAIFYSWAVILEDPPSSPPTNSSGQMLVCWWLIACLLITTAFKSALIAHLTVKGSTPPIDSYEDLLEKTGWNWGFEKLLLRGAPLFYFKFSPDPKVQEIYQKLEGINSKEGLEKVKRGGYSLLATKNRVTSFIDLYQSDVYGRHPFYFSKKSYSIASDIGIGFRKGAPFKHRFAQMIDRLAEAGIINYWIRNVLADQGRDARRKRREQLQQGEIEIPEMPSQNEVTDQQVVLQMTHMMGIFFLYVIGNIGAMVAFLLEKNL